MSDDVFVAAFFDQPGLLGVRVQGAARRSHAARFATRRRADVAPSMTSGCGPLIGAGLLLAFGGMFLLRGCGTAFDFSAGGGASPALPVLTATSTVDAAGNRDWAARLPRLADDLAPARADLLPYAVRTLLDVPAELARRTGDATGGWLAPAPGVGAESARAAGRNLADGLAGIEGAEGLAVLLDLPGPQAVAAATGMASLFTPVFTMDNLPHGRGVVSSADTLAAAVYWRPRLVAAATERSCGAAPVFVLEGDRLSPYANEVDRFDNRSVAHLPDADGFFRLGVRRLVYVRPQAGAVAEQPDLTELFVACAAAGITVAHVALAAVHAPVESTTRGSTHPATLWFLARYGAAGMPATAPDTDARYRAAPAAAPFRASGLDGGARQRETLFAPHRHHSGSSSGSGGRSSSGGSWGRASSSSFG